MSLDLPPWKKTLAVVTLAQFTAGLGFSFVGPFLPLYVEQLGTNTSWSLETLCGLVYSVQAFTMALTSPFWGMIGDRYGRKLMVMRTMLGGACVYALMAFAHSAEELILLRAVQGMLTGAIAASSALIAGIVPKNQSGYAFGMLQVGMWGGHAAGPILGGVVADLFGYQATFAATALFLALGGFAVWAYVTEPVDDPGRAQKVRESYLSQWRHLLSMRQIYPTLLQRFSLVIGWWIMRPFLPLFVVALLPASENVASLTGVVMASAAALNTAASVMMGKLGDKVGYRRVTMGCAALTAMGLVLLSLVEEYWQLLVLYSLVGMGTGGLLSSLSALLVQHTESGQEGKIFGLDNSVKALGRTLAPMLGTLCFGWFSMSGVFITSGLTFLVIILLCMASPLQKAGKG